ncbi:MAG: DUF362 domain-containing protein [Deltaproteobacteria bacterium]|nr:DUF362 domain-containing protein [Deltaproteobacteria bacterium]
MTGQKARVSIVRGTDIESSIRRALNLLGGIKTLIHPGRKVMLKPNFAVPVAAETGIITDPQVVEIIIKICLEAKPAELVVAESAVVGFDTDQVFSKLDLKERFEPLGANLVNLDKDEIVHIRVANGSVLKNISIFRTAYDSDVIISIPAMKTHILTSVTLGLKNMKGVLPDAMKKRMHRIGVKKSLHRFELDHAIADLNSVIKPALTIIDGFIANEGYKPGTPGIGGTPLKFDTTVAGTDPVAVDTVGAYLMGFDPAEIRHIAYAGKKNVGISDMNRIQILGEPPERVRRKFQQPSREDKIFDFKDISVVSGKGCSGCREAFFIGLSSMSEDELARIGNATVVLGSDVELSDKEKKNRLILVGNCTAKSILKGQHIEGCPPPGFHVKNCLLKAC